MGLLSLKFCLPSLKFWMTDIRDHQKVWSYWYNLVEQQAAKIFTSHHYPSYFYNYFTNVGVVTTPIFFLFSNLKSLVLALWYALTHLFLPSLSHIPSLSSSLTSFKWLEAEITASNTINWLHQKIQILSSFPPKTACLYWHRHLNFKPSKAHLWLSRCLSFLPPFPNKPKRSEFSLHCSFCTIQSISPSEDQHTEYSFMSIKTTVSL